jgi:hypothetical protein
VFSRKNLEGKSQILNLFSLPIVPKLVRRKTSVGKERALQTARVFFVDLQQLIFSK